MKVEKDTCATTEVFKNYEVIFKALADQKRLHLLNILSVNGSSCVCDLINELDMPQSWNGFLEDSTHGASCLGPLAGLTEKKELYEKTVHALSDREKTTLILVSRPDVASFKEAERASLINQINLIIKSYNI